VHAHRRALLPALAVELAGAVARLEARVEFLARELDDTVAQLVCSSDQEKSMGVTPSS